jgi:GNAT acetyltransferase
MMSFPELELKTGFVLDDRGRIVSTREPQASRGPLFVVIRSATACAWAVHRDVPEDVATVVAALATNEEPTSDLRLQPAHAAEFLSLTNGRVGFCGPAFAFPDRIDAPPGVIHVEDESLLGRHFRGWVPSEIAAGRAPVCAVVDDEYPVSVCFSARSSDIAAAAGLETADGFRRRGFATRVVAASAIAIRAEGRLPLYSAAWGNDASLAVAGKLGLTAFASFWSVPP